MNKNKTIYKEIILIFISIFLINKNNSAAPEINNPEDEYFKTAILENLINEYFKNIPILIPIGITENIIFGKNFYFKNLDNKNFKIYKIFFHQFYNESNKIKPTNPIFLSQIINRNTNNNGYLNLSKLLKIKSNFILKKENNFLIYEEKIRRRKKRTMIKYYESFN